LWEYGVGDAVRQSTVASLRRAEDGLYEAEADVETEVTFKSARLEVSADRKAWKEVPGVSLKVVPGAKVWLRVKTE
jgi:hypothetical protein